jgi:serine/threonine-protein kinase
MTQGRKPSPEPVDSGTLFEPSKESSGQIAAPTPPPPSAAPTEGSGNDGRGGTPTDIATGVFDPVTPSLGGNTPVGELPSSSGIQIDLEGAAALKPNQVLFDRYLVERQLGEGGMGTVWLVKHLGLDAERALKLIVSGIARDPQAKARFLREARILERLNNHPNAVRVHDVRVGRDIAFIEMEYVRGKSLNQLLVPGEPKSVEWVADLLDQLCSVLQAANDEGIIHRDLKPPNLMLVEGREPGTKVLKLLDFGIAKIREGADDVRTLTGSFMGTPLYSSPEQIVGERVDVRSDIYSVGLILYELLTGYQPFDGSINAIIYKHTMVPAPPFAETNPEAHVPPAIEAVVLQCLAKEPDQRPQTPRQLAELFHEALAQAHVPNGTRSDKGKGKDKGTATATLDTPVVPPPWVEKARRIALFAAFGLLLALSIGLALNLRQPGSGGSRVEGDGKGSSGRRPVVVNPPKEKTPRWVGTQPVDRRVLEERLKHWESQGFAPDPTAGTVSPGGWPRALLRIEDQKKRPADQLAFLRHASGIYIPRGCEPSSDPAADGKPRTLERAGTTERNPITYIRIPGGTFRLGWLAPLDPANAPAAGQAGPEVTLTGFYMQKTEVTNGEIDPFLGNLGIDVFPEWRKNFNRLTGKLGASAARLVPATEISWRYAMLFAQVQGGKLPTEAQWEFAARSGGKNYLKVWGLGDEPKHPGNIGNIREAPEVVGSHDGDVTEQGVYDLTGNVQEWCRDVFKAYEPSTQVLIDPQFPPRTLEESDRLRMVVRGGWFNSPLEDGSTTSRNKPIEGSNVTKYLGFRIVIECPEGPPDPP